MIVLFLTIYHLNFNPRSYKRSDITDLDDGTQNNDFNPRSYKRSDDREIGIPSLPYQFQSTLLQEERRQKCTIILILICNNYCIVSIKSHQHYNNYFM